MRRCASAFSGPSRGKALPLRASTAPLDGPRALSRTSCEPGGERLHCSRLKRRQCPCRVSLSPRIRLRVWCGGPRIERPAEPGRKQHVATARQARSFTPSANALQLIVIYIQKSCSNRIISNECGLLRTKTMVSNDDNSAVGVVVSFKIPILETRVRFPDGAFALRMRFFFPRHICHTRVDLCFTMLLCRATENALAAVTVSSEYMLLFATSPPYPVIARQRDA